MNRSIFVRLLALAGVVFVLVAPPVVADETAPAAAAAPAPAAATQAPAAAECPAPNRPVADKWALIIGISQFADPSLNLKYPAKDAKDLYNYLVTDGRFAKDHVKLLIDHKATRENILSAVGDKWLPKVANADDLVVVFISSHGSPSDTNVGNVSYIVAHNTDKANLYATGVAMQDLSEIFKSRVKSDRLVLIMDACHSGNAASDTKGLVRATNVSAEELAAGTGKIVISSSEPSQQSWESKDYQNGVFTHQLIEGLRQKESACTLGEAFQFMKDKVQEEVLRDQGAMQTPVMRGTTGGTGLALAAAPTRPGPVPADAEPANPEAAESQEEATPVAMVTPAEANAAAARLWETYLESGVKARTEGRYAESEKMLKESIAEAEKLGTEKAQYASSLNELGELERVRGQYTDAEPLLKRALAIREKALGAQEPAVAQSLNNVALVLQGKGKYSEAETLLRRALEIAKLKPGEETAESAQIMNNLARDLFEKGKYAEAEQLCRRSLAIRESVLGADSPFVAESLVTLGRLNYKLGKYPDARKLLVRSIAIREKILGPEHPDLIESLNSLAQLATVQRRYTEAEPLYYRSLAIAEKAFGPDHAAVADSLNQLALLYELRLKFQQAETNYKRALEIREKALGPNHPAVAESLTNLAWLTYAQEQYPQADSLFRRAQSISERALEPDNPTVAATLEYYAYLLRATSRMTQATQLQAKVKAMRAKHTLENPNSRLKTDSAILSARSYALSAKRLSDKKN